MDLDAAIASAPIAAQAADILYWVFLGIFMVNLTQRRHQDRCRAKRFATLYLGIAGFAAFLAAQLIVFWGAEDWMLLPAVGGIITIVYYYRAQTWPFRLTNPLDGRRLTLQQVLYDDTHGQS